MVTHSLLSELLLLFSRDRIVRKCGSRKKTEGQENWAGGPAWVTHTVTHVSLNFRLLLVKAL